jgi:hypothetical protein
MDEQAIERAVRELRDSAPPSFDFVTGGPVGRRVRKLRLGAALLLIILGASAPFVLRPPDREREIVLLAPPTTDWLLQTPDPAWVAQLDHDNNEEPSNVR